MDPVMPSPRRSARLGNAAPPTSIPSPMHTTTTTASPQPNSLPAKRKRTISASGVASSSKRTHLTPRPSSSSLSAETQTQTVSMASTSLPTARAQRHIRRHPSVFDVDEDPKVEKEVQEQPVASTSYLPLPSTVPSQATSESLNLRRRGKKKENVITKEMMLMEKNGGAVLPSRRTSLRTSTRLSTPVPPSKLSTPPPPNKGKAPLVPVRIPTASTPTTDISTSSPQTTPHRSNANVSPPSELHEGGLVPTTANPTASVATGSRSKSPTPSTVSSHQLSNPTTSVSGYSLRTRSQSRIPTIASAISTSKPKSTPALAPALDMDTNKDDKTFSDSTLTHDSILPSVPTTHDNNNDSDTEMLVVGVEAGAGADAQVAQPSATSSSAGILHNARTRTRTRSATKLRSAQAAVAIAKESEPAGGSRAGSRTRSGSGLGSTAEGGPNAALRSFGSGSGSGSGSKRRGGKRGRRRSEPEPQPEDGPERGDDDVIMEENLTSSTSTSTRASTPTPTTAISTSADVEADDSTSGSASASAPSSIPIPIIVDQNDSEALLVVGACGTSFLSTDAATDATKDSDIDDDAILTGPVSDVDAGEMIVDGPGSDSGDWSATEGEGEGQGKPPSEWVTGGQALALDSSESESKAGAETFEEKPRTDDGEPTTFKTELPTHMSTSPFSAESSSPTQTQTRTPLAESESESGFQHTSTSATEADVATPFTDNESESESTRGRSLSRSRTRRSGMKRVRRGSRRGGKEGRTDAKGDGKGREGAVSRTEGEGGRRVMVCEKAPDSLWKAACRFRVDVLASQYSTRLAEYETDRAHEFFFAVASSPSPLPISSTTSYTPARTPSPLIENNRSSSSSFERTTPPSLSIITNSSGSSSDSCYSSLTENLNASPSISTSSRPRRSPYSPTWHFSMHWEERRHDAGEWDGRVDDMHPHPLSSLPVVAPLSAADDNGQIQMQGEGAEGGEMEVDFREEDCYDWELCETDSSSGSDGEEEGEGEGAFRHEHQSDSDAGPGKGVAKGGRMRFSNGNEMDIDEDSDDDDDDDDMEDAEAVSEGLVEGEMQLDFQVSAPASGTQGSTSGPIATAMTTSTAGSVAAPTSTPSSLADALTPLGDASSNTGTAEASSKSPNEETRPMTSAFALAVYEHEPIPGSPALASPSPGHDSASTSERGEGMDMSTSASTSNMVSTHGPPVPSDSSPPVTAASPMLTPLSVQPSSLSLSDPQSQPQTQAQSPSPFSLSCISFYNQPHSQFPQPLPLPPPPLSSIPVRDLGLRDMDQFTAGFDEELPAQVLRQVTMVDDERFGSPGAMTIHSYARTNTYQRVGDTNTDAEADGRMTPAGLRLLTPFKRRLNYRSRRLGSIARGTPIDPDRRRRWVAWLEEQNQRQRSADIDSEMRSSTGEGERSSSPSPYPRIGSSVWYAMRFPTSSSRSPRSRSHSLSGSSTPLRLGTSEPSSPDASPSEMSSFLSGQQPRDQDMVMFENLQAPDRLNGQEFEAETEASLGIGQYGDLRAVVRWREAKAVLRNRERLLMMEGYKLDSDNRPQPLRPDVEQGSSHSAFGSSEQSEFQQGGTHDSVTASSYAPCDPSPYSADMGDGLSDEDAEGDVDPDVAEPVSVTSFASSSGSSMASSSMNSGTQENERESARVWEAFFGSLAESGSPGGNANSMSDSSSGTQNIAEGNMLSTSGPAETGTSNEAFDRRNTLMPPSSTSSSQEQINPTHFQYSSQPDISHGNENVSASSNSGTNPQLPSDAGMYGMVNMGMGMGMAPLRVSVPGSPAPEINASNLSGTASLGFGFVGVGVGMGVAGGLGVDVMGMGMGVGMGMSMGLGFESEPWFFPSPPSSASSQSSNGGDNPMQQLQVVQAQQFGALGARGPLGLGMNIGVPMDIDSSVVPPDQPMEGIRFSTAGGTESAYPLGFAMG